MPMRLVIVRHCLLQFNKYRRSCGNDHFCYNDCINLSHIGMPCSQSAQITNEYHVQTRNGTKDPLAMCLAFFFFFFTYANLKAITVFLIKTKHPECDSSHVIQRVWIKQAAISMHAYLYHPLTVDACVHMHRHIDTEWHAHNTYL